MMGEALLLQVAATAGDTLIMKQVVAEPGVFQQIATVASGVMSIALVVLTIALVPAAWNFRKSYRNFNHLLERVYGDINPLMRHASSIADNVDYITTAVRTDVQRVNATINSANLRLQEAVAVTEERLQAFNALLDVVQREAEDIFVSSAATVRGVRTSAEALRREVRADLAGAELDHTDFEEEWDGSDDSHGAGTGPARPRVRPRPRQSGRRHDA
jgi:hypothetical protein